MKKFLLIFIFLFSILFSIWIVNWGWCYYSKWDDLDYSLKNCLDWTSLVDPGADLEVTNGWFSEKIYNISKTIAIILSLWAVLWIVYWSFLMVTAAWEDEKVKKWKDVIKWSIVWFLWVVLASSLIVLITRFIFDLK